MILFVKPDEDRDSAAAGAIAAYNAIESGPFTDLQQNVLNLVVRSLTGYVPAGFESDKDGRPNVVKNHLGVPVSGKPEKGGVSSGEHPDVSSLSERLGSLSESVSSLNKKVESANKKPAVPPATTTTEGNK